MLKGFVNIKYLIIYMFICFVKPNENELYNEIIDNEINKEFNNDFNNIVLHTIKGKININDIKELNNINENEIPNIKAVMNGILREIYIDNDGNFEIFNIAKGIYILDFIMNDYYIPSIRVIINDSGEIVMKRIDLNNPLISKRLDYPIELTLTQKSEFYIKNSSFNIFGLLSNPMVTKIYVRNKVKK